METVTCEEMETAQLSPDGEGWKVTMRGEDALFATWDEAFDYIIETFKQSEQNLTKKPPTGGFFSSGLDNVQLCAIFKA